MALYRCFEMTDATLPDPLAQKQYRQSSLRLLTGVGETCASALANAKKRSSHKVNSRAWRSRNLSAITRKNDLTINGHGYQNPWSAKCFRQTIRENLAP